MLSCFPVLAVPTTAVEQRRVPFPLATRVAELVFPLCCSHAEDARILLTGAPNEHFSENEPLTTENENLDAFKAFSSAFLCCWKEVICSSLPAG